MALAIDVPVDIETRVRAEAAHAGVSVEEWARQKLNRRVRTRRVATPPPVAGREDDATKPE